MGTLLLFSYALVFALAEIEIEGAHGWAERLPTWYRVTPGYARLFRRLMSNKPLTGYHAVMLPLTLVSFHLGFAFGAPWSLALELTILARYVLWVIVWDFLWFLLNPHFGWRNFRSGRIWWLGRRWLGRLPGEYVNALLTSFAIAAVHAALAHTWAPVRAHATFCAVSLACVLAVAPFAPAYGRWYAHMRRDGSDERDRAVPRP